MTRMELKELVEVGEVEQAHGNMSQRVTGMAFDSGRVERGNVFFAVPGTRADGHDFVPLAIERGAAAVVVERKPELTHGAAWVRVANVRRTMGQWAAHYYAYPSRRLVVVGVTGTNGKTTVTYLVESIFLATGMSPGVIGTVNYRYRGKTFPALHTTPESIQLQSLLAEMVSGGVNSVAMEVSSHALAQERVRGIDFDVALFTNLSRDHLDFHGDMEGYFSAKSRFFTDYLPQSSKSRKVAVIHGEDPRGAELAERARKVGVEVFTYGRGTEWDVHPVALKSGLSGQEGKIQVRDRQVEFSSRLIGETNLENILGAVAVGFALGLSPREVADGVARCETVPGRLERVPNRREISVVVDYAHTPDALEKALRALRPLGSGRLIAVFGCGGDRDRGKRPLMGEIAARLSDLVVLTSDNPRTEEPLKILEEVEAGVKKTGLRRFQISNLKSQSSDLRSEILNLRSYLVEPDRRSAIRRALALARAGDMVLIAGKGHEDYQILGSKRIHFDDREVVREELGEER
jgi:UDP-N-acetylmuramoyl-L-alanyl-D-glutamate--2,6-diaminopimelate ligase